jgi:hypothetical protein
MNSLFSSLGRLTLVPFLSLPKRHYPVPLDGTDNARLVNMRVLREKASGEPTYDPINEVWFRYLHSEVHSTRQCKTEQSLTSWFLKGYENYRPSWGKVLEEDRELLGVERAWQAGTMNAPMGYHPSIEGMLEKIDDSWKQGGEDRKRIPHETNLYWSSRWSAHFEQPSPENQHIAPQD